MQKVNRLSDWKSSEAPLSLHILNEVKTCLKFGLQLFKGCELLLRQRLSCQYSTHDDLLQCFQIVVARSFWSRGAILGILWQRL